MSKGLDKKAREVILGIMTDRGVMTREEVMDLVRVHFMFDPIASKEREIRRKANRLMAQLKDKQGIRTCLNCTDNKGQSKYINVETTEDVESLVAVAEQIYRNYNGLRKTAKKVNARLLELGGQISMFGDEDEGVL
ncbi:MAG: hypothetical protein ACYDEJ_03470 [Desulfitobacteriaceae bacterium]